MFIHQKSIRNRSTEGYNVMGVERGDWFELWELRGTLVRLRTFSLNYSKSTTYITAVSTSIMLQQ